MNKKHLRLYICLLTASLTCLQNFSCAQKQGQERIDSMKQVLHTQLLKDPQWAGSNKVLLLSELAYKYHMADPDEGLKTAEEALTLAEKLDWKKGIANSCNRLGLCYWAKADYPKAMELLFRALSIFEELGNKEGQAIVLGNIGLVYYGQGDNEQSLQYDSAL